MQSMQMAKSEGRNMRSGQPHRTKLHILLRPLNCHIIHNWVWTRVVDQHPSRAAIQAANHFNGQTHAYVHARTLAPHKKSEFLSQFANKHTHAQIKTNKYSNKCISIRKNTLIYHQVSILNPEQNTFFTVLQFLFSKQKQRFDISTSFWKSSSICQSTETSAN